ncbi:MAG: hypothetical protein SFU25_05175 [Candidatus Caenarcaniphilales bacterium]|nr:hypothetical protein [Candidatus Caenarcaniphilales bacterium]
MFVHSYFTHLQSLQSLSSNKSRLSPSHRTYQGTLNSAKRESYGNSRTVLPLSGGRLAENKLTDEFYKQARGLLAALKDDIPHATNLSLDAKVLGLDEVNEARRTKFKLYLVAVSNNEIKELLEEYILPQYIEAAQRQNTIFKVTNQIGKIKELDPKSRSKSTKQSESKIEISEIVDFNRMNEMKKQLVRTALLMREMQGLNNPELDCVVNNSRAQSEAGEARNPEYQKFLTALESLNDRGFVQIANNLGTSKCFQDDLISKELQEVISALGKENLWDSSSLFDIDSLSLQDIFEIAEVFDQEMELKKIALRLIDPEFLLTQSSIDVTADLKTRCEDKGFGIPSTVVVQGLNLTPDEYEEISRKNGSTSHQPGARSKQSRSATTAFTETKYIERLSPEEAESFQKALNAFSSLEQFLPNGPLKPVIQQKIKEIGDTLNSGNTKQTLYLINSLQQFTLPLRLQTQLRQGESFLNKFIELRSQNIQKAKEEQQRLSLQAQAAQDAKTGAKSFDQNSLEIDFSRIPLSEDKQNYNSFWGRFSTEEIESFIEFFHGRIGWDEINPARLRIFINSLTTESIDQEGFQPQVLITLFGEQSSETDIENQNRISAILSLNEILFHRKEKVRIEEEKRQTKAKESAIKSATTPSSSPAKKKKPKVTSLHTPLRTVIPSIDREVTGAVFSKNSLFGGLVNAQLLTQLKISRQRLIASIASPVLVFNNYEEYRNSPEYNDIEGIRSSGATLPTIEIEGKKYFTTQVSPDEMERLKPASQKGLGAIQEINGDYRGIIGTGGLNEEALQIEDTRLDSLIQWTKGINNSQINRELVGDFITFLIEENQKLIPLGQSFELLLNWPPEGSIGGKIRDFSSLDLQAVKDFQIGEDKINKLSDKQIKGLLNALEHNLQLSKTRNHIRNEFLRLFELEKTNTAASHKERKQLNIGFSNDLEKAGIHPQVVKAVLDCPYEELLRLAHRSIFLNPSADENDIFLLSNTSNFKELEIINCSYQGDIEDLKSNGIPITINQLLEIMREHFSGATAVLPQAQIIEDASNELLARIINLSKKDIKAIKNFLENSTKGVNSHSQGKLEDDFNFYRAALSQELPHLFKELHRRLYISVCDIASELSCSEGKYVEAIKYARNTLELDPGSLKANICELTALASIGRFDEMGQRLNQIKTEQKEIAQKSEFKFLESLLLISEGKFEKSYELLKSLKIHRTYNLALTRNVICILLEHRLGRKISDETVKQISNTSISSPKDSRKIIGETLDYLVAANFFDPKPKNGDVILTVSAPSQNLISLNATPGVGLVIQYFTKVN